MHRTTRIGRRMKPPAGRSMRVCETFDEISVYAGIAERTGVQVDRAAVRHSAGCCRSVTELLRKARSSGDGTFYLPLDLWPPELAQMETQKPWIVVSSLARPARPKPHANDDAG